MRRISVVVDLAMSHPHFPMPNCPDPLPTVVPRGRHSKLNYPIASRPTALETVSRLIAGDDVVGFFDTEPAAFPPRVRMASFASSREKPASEPVTTIVRLCSVRGTRSSAES